VAQPCHVSVHPTGRYVFVSSWGSGSFVVLPVDGDGALGRPTHVIENPKPYAHMMVPERRGRWVLGINLAAGTVSSYQLDLDPGRLRLGNETRMAAGAGPRHLAFHPAGETLYVVNELNSTMTACVFDGTQGASIRGRASAQSRPNGPARISPRPCVLRPTGGLSRLRIEATTASPWSQPSLGSGWSPRSLRRRVPEGHRDRRRGSLALCRERAQRPDHRLAVDPHDGALVPTGQALAFSAPTCLLSV
jgi:hypothetical protein